ncbi:hypothetical protein Psal006b_03668 (plasmid) [Piscirickettsia salmonis]|nr:hypothetical protein [Piscirickettsia salmonis]AKP75005.1 hypothetical protein PSLF89_2p18 [Piscirickettsia salmonis LF-89 = ATCC VR-1361]ALY04579.1 hypothetical protein AWE47_16840 [Piscirickettsia salmonis]AMA44022.1 hypothetical protein AWJ11_16720 [Piscirickettsia salmonis]AOS36903.1 hypothetical protein AVM72_16165 [Piscirickettsia salmonis]APS65595.1 hypothetical protein AVI54_17470 [Piscirickettsia salmonis]
MPKYDQMIQKEIEQSSRRLYKDVDALRSGNTPVEMIPVAHHTVEYSNHKAKLSALSSRMPQSEAERTRDIHDFIAHSSARAALSGLARCEESLTSFMKVHIQSEAAELLPYMTVIFFNVQDPKVPENKNNHCFLMLSANDPSAQLQGFDFKTQVARVNQARQELLSVFERNPGDNYLVDPYLVECVSLKKALKGNNAEFMDAYDERSYLGLASADLGTVDSRDIDIHLITKKERELVTEFKQGNPDFVLNNSIHHTAGPWKDRFQFPFLSAHEEPEPEGEEAALYYCG